MLPQSHLNEELGLEPSNKSAPPNPWQIISSVVAALAAVASLITQWKGNRTLAYVLVAVALIAASSILYRPIAARAHKYLTNSRRGRVARRVWPEFLRIENRLGMFLNKNDMTNLRNILAELHGRQEEAVNKLCGPDYLPDYYALFRERHVTGSARNGFSFYPALSELHHMVYSYNQDYALEPLRRLKAEPIILQQLHPRVREDTEERIKAFREKWVRFLDDYTEFTDKTNHELRYDYQEAIGTYFERPKTL